MGFLRRGTTARQKSPNLMDDAYDNGKIFNFMKTLKIVVFNLIFSPRFHDYGKVGQISDHLTRVSKF